MGACRASVSGAGTYGGLRGGRRRVLGGEHEHEREPGHGYEPGHESGHGDGHESGHGDGHESGHGTVPISAFEEFANLRAAISGLPAADQQQRLDAFIAAKSAGEEGFPLRLGSRAAFVWKGRPSSAPQLAGEWNGWSASVQSLAQIGATDVWFIEASLGSSARAAYKLVIDGDWRSDPLNRKFTYDHGNSVANLAGSGASHLEVIEGFRSTALGNARDVYVYLPPGYLDDAQARYPVLYMHDGQNLFDPSAFWGGWGVDEACDRLIGAGTLKKLIVVGISNDADRMSEYTHVEDDLSQRCDGSQVTGGRAALYADFVVNELKPAIEGRYRTLSGRENAGVLGSSLGGLVSLWIGYRHPGAFKNVGGMSSTFDWGSFCPHTPPRETMRDVVARAGKQDFLLYLDSGAGPTSDFDNYNTTVDLRNLCQQQGFVQGQDLLWYWDQGAQHNEAAWRGRLDKPLLFWFRR